MDDMIKVCRRYANVTYSSKAHDPIIKGFCADIAEHEQGLESYFKEKSSLAKSLIDELGTVSKENFYDPIKAIIKKGFSYDKKLGSKLDSKKDKLEGLLKIAKDSYNIEANLIYRYSEASRKIEESLYRLSSKKETLRPQIEELAMMHEDKQSLMADLKEKVKQRYIKQEEQKSDDFIEQAAYALIKKGEERLKELCKEYLMIDNDEKALKRFHETSSDILRKHEDLADSYLELTQNIARQACAAQRVINTYHVVTENEIALLEMLELPEGYVKAVNELASRIEEIDRAFAKRLLEAFVKGGNAVKDVNLETIISGLVKKARQGEL